MSVHTTCMHQLSRAEKQVDCCWTTEKEPQIYGQSGHFYRNNQTAVGTASKGIQDSYPVLTSSFRANNTFNLMAVMTTSIPQLLLLFKKLVMINQRELCTLIKHLIEYFLYLLQSSMLYVQVSKTQTTVSPPRGPQDEQPIVVFSVPHRRLLSNELVSQASRLSSLCYRVCMRLLRAFPNLIAYILHPVQYPIKICF